MSRDSKRSTSERLKYGICLNDECSMCKSKEIQSIPMRKDLLCSECGKELRECPPPKKKGKSPIILVSSIVVVAVVVGLFFILSGNKNAVEDNAIMETHIVEETIVAEAVTNAVQDVVAADTSCVDKVSTPTTSTKPVVEPQKTTGNGNLTLSYGKYSGAIKNGYPHGQGKLTYTKTRVINRYDMKSREAQPGNYVIGEFHNGFVVYGKLYDANGNLLSSLNFGVSNEDNYDSK